jgi:hypothetical protein
MNCNKSISNDPWHCLSCVQVRKNEINLRHDAVNKVIQLYAQYANAIVQHEPSGLSDESSQIRPDCRIILDSLTLLVDVTIVHPTARGKLENEKEVERMCQKSLITASDAAQSKRNKYRSMASYQGAQFIPFAIETYGGMEKSVMELLKEIGTFAVDHESAWGRKEIINNCLQAMAIAVQRGNAAAAITGSLTYRTGGHRSEESKQKYMSRGREKRTAVNTERC